jgi:hypothetical protein
MDNLVQNSNPKYHCFGCTFVSNSSRGLSLHWYKFKKCAEISNTTSNLGKLNPKFIHEIEHQDNNSNTDDHASFGNDNDTDDVNDNEYNVPNYATNSPYAIAMEDHKNVAVKIELLKLLNTAKAPLYLFDSIMTWAKNAVNKYDVDFGIEKNTTRQNFIKELKLKYRLDTIEPTIKEVKLRGSGNTIELVTHSFKHSFYSILNDDHLMASNNLLINKESIFEIDTIRNGMDGNYNDISTGIVYQKAKKEYLTQPNDVLCPIIFFIDKTHTDVNGRLCLEPIRFTIGIFNRETRNNPRAWRSLGYIHDQAQMKKVTPLQKAIDYHHMMEVILEEFKQCQSEGMNWQLKLSNETFDVNFKIPVLFIIGDTEGQDKICGRFTSRSNVSHLCRCCDCPFEETDNPEFKYKLNNHQKIMKKIRKSSKQELRSIAMHKLTNAWADVKFCDSERGLFGAVCGDLMHCLQHGLFTYLVTLLFDQKKIRNVLSDQEIQESVNIYSTRSAFPEAYCTEFDAICRSYGKMLMHQSDRSLQRTHFYSNYTTVTRKNASEMSGILLVYLMVFNSSEGEQNIDNQLGEGRTAKFIHLFELMLMLESVLKQDDLKIGMVRLLHKFMPFLLNTFKETINRQVGCQMKIIKFHLPVHFASDIQRFGVMNNFDTGIGESHHKSEAKLPAKNTQRRRSKFELQTAQRQIENIAINIAHSNICRSEEKLEADRSCVETCKWFRYIFDENHNISKYKSNNQRQNREICQWKDTQLQKQLQEACTLISTQNCVKLPFRFFSQYNRGGSIFRADPAYESNEPWYDWVTIQWMEDGIIPAKLLLFWDIDNDSFQKPFTIGSTHVNTPGTYVIAHSLLSSESAIKAHGASHLVKYAKIEPLRDFCIIPVESIYSPIVALPYHINENIYSANEWILLTSKDNWKQIFYDFMKLTLTNMKKPTKTSNKKNLKRKDPPK